MNLHRVLLIAVVPPVVSTILATSSYILGGGRAACFESLDLDTPGLLCATSFHIMIATAIFAALHLVVALPGALFLRRILQRGSLRGPTVQRWATRVLFSVLVLWVVGVVLVQTASGHDWLLGLLGFPLPTVVQIALLILILSDGPSQPGFALKVPERIQL